MNITIKYMLVKCSFFKVKTCAFMEVFIFLDCVKHIQEAFPLYRLNF